MSSGAIASSSVSGPAGPVPRLGFPETAENSLLGLTQHFLTTQRNVLDTALETAEPKDLQLIFGDMALHLAGIECASDATPAERSEKVALAVQRIAGTPDLLSRIANASFEPVRPLGAPGDGDTTEKLTVVERPPVRLNRHERKKYEKLKSEIAVYGGIKHWMLPPGRAIRLEYMPSADYENTQIVDGMRSDATTNDKIASIIVETIQDGSLILTRDYYNDYRRDDGGYKDFVRSEKVPVTGLYRVLAAEDNASYRILRQFSWAADRIDTVQGLTGKLVTFDRLDQGSELQSRHGHWLMRDKVQIDHENDALNLETRSKNWEPDLKLVQAYFGDTTDYPLFTR